VSELVRNEKGLTNGEAFEDNQVRQRLFALAYNLGNFLRRLALPSAVKHRTLTTLQDKPIKIVAKVVHNARRVLFQMAEIAIPRPLFVAMLGRIGRLRLLVPAPTWPLHVGNTSNSTPVSAIGLSTSRRRPLSNDLKTPQMHVGERREGRSVQGKLFKATRANFRMYKIADDHYEIRVIIFTDTSSEDWATQMESDHRQLVGELCVKCGKPITGHTASQFCQVCHSPVHLVCMPSPRQADSCPRCGASPSAQAAHRMRYDTIARETEKALKFSRRLGFLRDWVACFFGITLPFYLCVGLYVRRLSVRLLLDHPAYAAGSLIAIASIAGASAWTRTKKRYPDTDEPEPPEQRPLTFDEALACGDLARLKELLNQNPDWALNNSGRLPLHVAAAGGQKDVADLLLANKAEINAKRLDGWTPLLVAAAAGHKDMVELLLASGADANSKGLDGSTALLVAAERDLTKIAELLISHGADVNVQSGYGRTPLVWSAINGNKTLAELLLANKADVNTGGGGGTPLHFAARAGHRDLIELLVGSNADVSVKDIDGATALDCAVRYGYENAAELLRKLGARE